MSKEKTKYRDLLVNQIKIAGQELIDRAEDFVGENMDMITDFSIYINMRQGECVGIDISTSTMCKNEICRIMKGE